MIDLRARHILLGDRATAEEEYGFFFRLHLPNGTYKTTQAGRLADFDSLIGTLLGPPRPIRILDLAVSSGVTTIDLVRSLEERGFSVEVVASDLALTAFIKTYPMMETLETPDESLLQMAVGRIALFPPHKSSSSLRAWIGRLVFSMARLARALPIKDCTEVQMVHSALRNHPTITLVEHDLQNVRPEWDGRFDLVRACNLISPAYFPSDVRRRMLRNCLSWCAPDGLFAVCRSLMDDNSNNGSVALLPSSSGAPLEFIGRIGTGSELDGEIISSWAELAGSSGLHDLASPNLDRSS